MIRIELDEASLGATRMAISPLRDAFCAMHLALPGRHPSWPYQEWVGHAREAWREDDRLRPLWDLFAEGRYEVSDFLLPRPVGTVDVRDELDLLRATDPEFVRAQAAVCYPHLLDAPFLAPYLNDPEAACGALADAYEAYWTEVVAPHWPVMRRLVEDEVLVRARTFATEGIDALFQGLESRVRWEPPVLELTKHLDAAYAPGERRLVLVPLVFAEGCRLYSVDDPEVFALSFQARGAAVLREPAAPVADDRLGLLLGRGRAAVLRELGGPLTTAGLADRLGLAPSTVSEHLSVLTDAGVVSRHRVGRSVYYEPTDTGRSLLALLTGEGVLDAVA